MSMIRAIEYYLPDQVIHNDPTDRMTSKIGIEQKHISKEDEFASDLAVRAAEKVFDSGIKREEIDYLLYCTQSPDYFLPTTACLIQERLGLSKECGALDFNLGCSGYIYGLSLAHGLIQSDQANHVLLITSDTYSKYVNKKDRNVELLFGDAATATVISKSNENNFHSFVFGTDGSGAANLIVPSGGLRLPASGTTSIEEEDEYGNIRSQNNLFMDGTEVYKFAMKEVPKALNKLINKDQLSMDDYDFFVFHQANKYMLESLRRKLKIAEEKFSIQMNDCGNTVSSTVPIALKRDVLHGNIKKGDKLVLVGFGVGYSWSACSITWNL